MTDPNCVSIIESWLYTYLHCEFITCFKHHTVYYYSSDYLNKRRPHYVPFINSTVKIVFKGHIKNA